MIVHSFAAAVNVHHNIRLQQGVHVQIRVVTKFFDRGMNTILVSSLLRKLISYVCVKANKLVLKCFSNVFVVWIVK